MKKLLLFLACLFSFPAFAADDRVSVVFDSVSIPDLCKVVFAQVLKQPYILSPEVLKTPETVSLQLKDVEKSALVVAVERVISSNGFQLSRRAGVNWIEKAEKKDDEEILLYRPRFRSSRFLVDIVQSVTGAKSLQARSISQSGMESPGLPAAPGGHPTNKKSNQVESPTSVAGQIDRSETDEIVFSVQSPQLAKVKKLLADLDTPVPEIMVKAHVYEVTLDDQDKSAFSLFAKLIGDRFNLSAGSLTAGNYSAVISLAGFQAVVDLIQSDTRFKAVSSPSMRVQSGGTARLQVGSETPVLSQASLDKNGNAVQSVEYKSSGVILDLRPQVHVDVIDLQVNQQISNFIPTTTGVSGSPTLIKRELATNVGIKGGDVLILGGLDENSATNDRSGLPGIGWFDSIQKKNHKSEILMLLQATRI